METFPITGIVLVDSKVPEKPKFIAIAANFEGGIENGPVATKPSCIASPEDGSFSLATYESGDGVAPGTYRLTFRLRSFNLMRAKFEGDDFKGKYDDPESSEVTVTVTGDETEPIDLGTIDLTLE